MNYLSDRRRARVCFFEPKERSGRAITKELGGSKGEENAGSRGVYPRAAMRYETGKTETYLEGKSVSLRANRDG